MLEVPHVATDVVKKQAEFLAIGTAFAFDEGEHTHAQYSALLCFLVNHQPGVEDSLEFKTVARFVCNALFKAKDPNALGRIATNVLAIIHLRGLEVGEVETFADLKVGMLSKIKRGQPLDLTPSQIIYLASQLNVQPGLFLENFDNNPEGLRQLLEAIPLPDEENDQVDCLDEEVRQTNGSPFLVLAEVGGLAKGAIMEDTSMTVSGQGAGSLSSTLSVAPATVANNVRAAAKRAGITITELMKIIGINNRRHLENIEKGEGAFAISELSKIAQRLDVDVSVFQTGEGLGTFRGRPKKDTFGHSLALVDAKKLPLPPVSEERRQNFFRERCLRKSVEMAEGADWHDILAAAGSQEPVDWYTLWLSVTKEGSAYKAFSDLVLKKTKPWGEVMKTVFFSDLHGQMFSVDETS